MLERKGMVPLILAGFGYFLSDYLTWSTLAFTFFCILTSVFGLKVPKMVRTLLVLVIITSYVLIYGKIFDPEVGLNFLTSVVLLKILESETQRDKYMIFFGLILLVASGSLFERSLEYTFFLMGSFLFLLSSFHKDREVQWLKKEIALTLFLILPLVAVLFFVVPRIMNPISLFGGKNQKGKIGFSKTVNMDEVESLAPSDEIAFYAVVPETVIAKELYWRGNALSLTDGWNWLESPKTQGIPLAAEEFEFKGLKQDIYLSEPKEYFFMLDWPLAHRSELRDRKIGKSGTLAQLRNERIKRYTVWSQKLSPVMDNTEGDNFKRSGLKSRDKEWIRKTFLSETPEDLLREIQDYFRKEEFIYTLSPGKIRDFSEFMKTKKGFCTHFASATAQILRVKGVPARLVSGYMGGTYNRLGNYYQIMENDAHVWVEIKSGERWARIDPTEWISPDRVSLGGDAFVKTQAGLEASPFQKFNFGSIGLLQDVRLEFERLNFIFYRLMDEMNYFSQLTILKNFGLEKKYSFFLIPLVVLTFSGLYLLFLQYLRREKNLERIAWRRFQRKLGKKDDPDLYSIERMKTKINNLKENKQERASRILESLIAHSFQGKAVNLLTVIREIKKL